MDEQSENFICKWRSEQLIFGHQTSSMVKTPSRQILNTHPISTWEVSVQMWTCWQLVLAIVLSINLLTVNGVSCFKLHFKWIFYSHVWKDFYTSFRSTCICIMVNNLPWIPGADPGFDRGGGSRVNPVHEMHVQKFRTMPTDAQEQRWRPIKHENWTCWPSGTGLRFRELANPFLVWLALLDISAQQSGVRERGATCVLLATDKVYDTPSLWGGGSMDPWTPLGLATGSY